MVERKQSTKPLWQKEIAAERIAILFKEAEKAAKLGKLEFSNRYVEMARKIGMRYNVRLPGEFKRKFCRYCHSYLRPEVSCKVDIDTKTKMIKVKCFKCDKIIHFPYK
jgi:ribonuclease P protein subunit RPR2